MSFSFSFLRKRECAIERLTSRRKLFYMRRPKFQKERKPSVLRSKRCLCLTKSEEGSNSAVSLKRQLDQFTDLRARRSQSQKYRGISRRSSWRPEWFRRRRRNQQKQQQSSTNSESSSSDPPMPRVKAKIRGRSFVFSVDRPSYV